MKRAALFLLLAATTLSLFSGCLPDEPRRVVVHRDRYHDRYDDRHYDHRGYGYGYGYRDPYRRGDTVVVTPTTTVRRERTYYY